MLLHNYPCGLAVMLYNSLQKLYAYFFYTVNSEHCHVYSLCTGGILAKWADDNRLVR